jgi:hypothetical protein
MKRTMQLSVIMFSLTSLGAYAHNVKFQLTNKSALPIWISCYFIDNNGNDAGILTEDKKILPNNIFSSSYENIQDDEEVQLELNISLTDPSQESGGRGKYCTYRTNKSATRKDKVLVWDHTKNIKNPLYPATDKRLMGLIKTTIDNNIRQNELKLTTNAL